MVKVPKIGNFWLRAFSSASRRLFSGNEEPALTEVLADPIVRLLMERDGVQMATLLLLIAETQRRLR